MNYEQYKFSLRFKDPEIEKSYWVQKNQFLLNDLKKGILLSLLFWIIGSVIFYITNPIKYLNEVLLIISVIFPIFIVTLILLSKKHFAIYAHRAALISNYTAAYLILYIGYMLPDELYAVLVGLILVIFIGLYLYRISKVSTIILVTSYSLAFLFLTLSTSGISALDFRIELLYCIIIPVFSITASHAWEKKDRELYLYKIIINKERARSDELLLNILPNEIAERLKKGEKTIANNHEQVTILFADIVGFTALSNELIPNKLVYLLNYIFTSFDEITNKHKLEKIKTIGDAYMVVGGLNVKDSGAVEIANFALEIQDFFNKDTLINEFNLQIRIGLHTGPVTAGVIGISKFSYDLWGDTVNIASRMESHSKPGKINTSEQSMKLLSTSFKFEKRPEMEIKGKGMMNTFFLSSF